MKAICELVLALMFVAPAHGQLGERNQLGLRMGHIHLMVRDIDAHKRFWTTLMGGRLVRNASWRRTISVRVRCRLATSSHPFKRRGRSML